MNKYFNRFAPVAASVSGLTALVVGMSANAVIDVTAATASLSDGILAVTTIGGAVLAVWAVRKVFSMIAR